jgi:hypothetical protein
LPKLKKIEQNFSLFGRFPGRGDVACGIGKMIKRVSIHELIEQIKGFSEPKSTAFRARTKIVTHPVS